jgi:hypothetical protein
VDGYLERDVLAGTRDTPEGGRAFLSALHAAFTAAGLADTWSVFAVSSPGSGAHVWLHLKPDQWGGAWQGEDAERRLLAAARAALGDPRGP